MRQEEEKVMLALCFFGFFFSWFNKINQPLFSTVYFQNLVLEIIPYSLFAESMYMYLLCSVVFFNLFK